ncbi:hypothetical protein BDF14DRAFT_1817062 [Spinellus fusiger]|nr:hypothetical protein BDF14DRAFT_1817062 [Spinellus fusiger]
MGKPIQTHSVDPTGTASLSMPENYTIDHAYQCLSQATVPSDRLHQCHLCGKAYKHAACLSKHRWEHSEEWALTSQWLLTKHQQVQMLEAAAILVSMDTRPISSKRTSIH